MLNAYLDLILLLYSCCNELKSPLTACYSSDQAGSQCAVAWKGIGAFTFCDVGVCIQGAYIRTKVTFLCILQKIL